MIYVCCLLWQGYANEVHETALIAAAREGWPEVVAVLCKNGANLEARSKVWKGIEYQIWRFSTVDSLHYMYIMYCLYTYIYLLLLNRTCIHTLSTYRKLLIPLILAVCTIDVCIRLSSCMFYDWKSSSEWIQSAVWSSKQWSKSRTSRNSFDNSSRGPRMVESEELRRLSSHRFSILFKHLMTIKVSKIILVTNAGDNVLF